MVGIFILFSLVLWYLIEWLKKVSEGFGLPDWAYRAGVFITALAGGVLLALQFRLDVFIMLAEVMGHTGIEESLTGQIFGGLVLASGSGGVYELLKAVKGGQELAPGAVIELKGTSQTVELKPPEAGPGV